MKYRQIDGKKEQRARHYLEASESYERSIALQADLRRFELLKEASVKQSDVDDLQAAIERHQEHLDEALKSYVLANKFAKLTRAEKQKIERAMLSGIQQRLEVVHADATADEERYKAELDNETDLEKRNAITPRLHAIETHKTVLDTLHDETTARLDELPEEETTDDPSGRRNN